MTPFIDEGCCPECGNDIKYPDNHDGADGACVECGAKFVLQVEEDGEAWSSEAVS